MAFEELWKRDAALQALQGGFNAPKGSLPTLALRQMALQKQNNDRDFALNESSVTGRYMSPDSMNIVKQLASLKNEFGSADPTRQKAIVGESNALRNDWIGRGLDANAIQSGISADEMYKRVGKLGQTVQENQRQFGNKLNLDQFDRSKFESDRNYNRGVFENNRSYGLQASNASRSQNNADLGVKFDIWKLTGQAPEGIPGVAAGTSVYDPTPPKEQKADLDSIRDSVERFYVQKDPDTGRYFIPEEEKMNAAWQIINMGLEDADTAQLLREYGLPDDPAFYAK